jgi:predicted dehydrogenase
MSPSAVVVGTGFGCRVHVPALRAAGFDVVALVGRDGERTARRAARLGVSRACTSLAEALDAAGGGGGPPAVTIATPPVSHARLAHQAIAAGCPVLVEKPFTMDRAEAGALAAAAAGAGVVAGVGHEFRWATDRAVAARAIAAGAVGQPRLATLVSHVSLASGPAPEWWFDPAAGGGWLGASGSHVVDQVRVWLGDFEAVAAALPRVAGRPAEDSFDVRFRLRSGVDGVMQQTAAAHGPMVSLTRVVGTAGTLWLEGDTAWLADAAGARALPVPPDLELPPPPTAGTTGPGHRFTHLELGPYTRLAEAFRAAIERQAAPADPRLATFDDGVAVMAVLDAIRASAGAGGAWTPVDLRTGG